MKNMSLLSPEELAVFRKLFTAFPDEADQYTQSIFVGLEIDNQLLQYILGKKWNNPPQNSEEGEKPTNDGQNDGCLDKE